MTETEAVPESWELTRERVLRLMTWEQRAAARKRKAPVSIEVLRQMVRDLREPCLPPKRVSKPITRADLELTSPRS